jgi:hypothetical protein
MVRPQLILPRADAGCGKAFYQDRRTAEWHRIALEFWIQATGRVRPDCRLAVYRCKRCGGFHVSAKRVENLSAPATPIPSLVPDRRPA